SSVRWPPVRWSGRQRQRNIRPARIINNAKLVPDSRRSWLRFCRRLRWFGNDEGEGCAKQILPLLALRGRQQGQRFGLQFIMACGEAVQPLVAHQDEFVSHPVEGGDIDGYTNSNAVGFAQVVLPLDQIPIALP